MSDPFFDDVVSLLHFDGTNGDTTTTDVIGGVAWTLSNPAHISTDVAVTGTTSLNLATGAGVGGAKSPDIPDIGTQDFTLEGHVYLAPNATVRCVLDTRLSEPDALGMLLYVTGDKLRLYVNGADRIVGTSTISTSSWKHWALVRISGVTRMYVAEVQEGGDYADATSYVNGAVRPMSIGEYATGGGNNLRGYADEVRTTIGTGRYPAEFPVTLPFPDAGPVLTPTIDTQPQSQTVTEGNNAVYTVAATSSGGTLLYQWYETTAGILGGETTDTLTITTVLGDNGNGYYVIVTDDNGATQSDTAALTVNAVGTISTLFDDSKGFPSEEYENAIDRITFMMQELEGSLCDCRDDPNVVVCVALLSSTGIYNTELQGGGEPDPVFGETLTLGVGVSGTGPYTYQWKVGGVDVVGATSLTFEYVVASSNASITVQVTNDCSTILVGPYLIQFCVGYDCEALYETATVAADAYWPMTDPMVTPTGTQLFHAGEPYGPYDDGLSKEWQLLWTWADLAPFGTRLKTIPFADFNYCEPTPTGTYDHYFDNIGSYFGSPHFRLYQNGSPFVVPNAGQMTQAAHHVFRDASSLDTLSWNGRNLVSGGSESIFRTVNPRGEVFFNVGTVKFVLGGGNALPTLGTEVDVAHSFDLSKPYVVTTEIVMTMTVTVVPSEIITTYTGNFTASQPGAATVSTTIVRVDQTINQFNNTTISADTGGVNQMVLGESGTNTYFMGIALGGTHAEILDGLARNYEDYECP